MFRYRLRTLLIATTWAGLIFLGLRSPTHLWSGVISVVTLLTILFAVLVALFRPGNSRAMATGFLLFCAGYLVHLMFIASWLNTSIGGGSSSLWSLFDALFRVVHPSGLYVNPDGMGNFTSIGHNAVACLLGLVGAIAAQILYVARRPDNGTHGNQQAAT